MKVYYNEYDKKKCAALLQLMIDGHISYGDIDDRPIQEVTPDDLREYTRCHFFAGIGLWDYALDLAGWEENRRVWTGSCPCQPFSSAGRQVGKGDDRHLWPEWFRLIEKCRPPTIFGEQVAAAIAQGWLDDVYQGLEKEEYAIGSIVLPASSIGAPHRRERLWFVAHSDMHRREQNREYITTTRGDGIVGNGSTLGDTGRVTEGDEEFGFGRKWEHSNSEKIRSEEGYGSSDTSTLDDPNGDEHQCTKSGIDGEAESVSSEHRKEDSSRGMFSRTGAATNTVADSNGQYAQGEQPCGDTERRSRQNLEQVGLCSGAGHWDEGVWIDCPDGKQRLVEPAIPLLAHGFPERVGVIHCAGDAIVPQVAAEFIKAAM